MKEGGKVIGSQHRRQVNFQEALPASWEESDRSKNKSISTHKKEE